MTDIVVINKPSNDRASRKPRVVLALLGGVGAAGITAFSAVTSLGISSGLATNLYYALNAISWAALAASIVASFGLGTALAGTIFGLAKKWALKKFVAW